MFAVHEMAGVVEDEKLRPGVFRGDDVEQRHLALQLRGGVRLAPVQHVVLARNHQHRHLQRAFALDAVEHFVAVCCGGLLRFAGAGPKFVARLFGLLQAGHVLVCLPVLIVEGGRQPGQFVDAALQPRVLRLVGALFQHVRKFRLRLWRISGPTARIVSVRAISGCSMARYRTIAPPGGMADQMNLAKLERLNKAVNEIDIALVAVLFVAGGVAGHAAGEAVDGVNVEMLRQGREDCAKKHWPWTIRP